MSCITGSDARQNTRPLDFEAEKLPTAQLLGL